MSDLDTPAIGRRIVWMMRYDRAGLIAILSGTLPSCWPDLARAYLTAIGLNDAAYHAAAVPGIVNLWKQLVKEHNAAHHLNTASAHHGA